MTDMFFHVEERRAWIRRHKRIVVYDRDPDFHRFVREQTGNVKLMLRIWLAEHMGGQPYLHAYLGTVVFCFIGPSTADIFRLFRFASGAAMATGESAKTLRHKLVGLLRQYIHQEYGT